MSFHTKVATLLVGCVTVLLLVWSLGEAAAQEEQEAKAVEAVKTAAPAQPTPPGQPPRQPSGQAPRGAPAGQEAPGAPAKAEQKPGEKPAEPVRLPRKPRQPANPDELKVRPGDDGLLSFSFKGQDWEDVLGWLADCSDMSLQMEEVPPGFCNLTTRGRYKVEQVRDLINSVLINKG